MYLSFGTQNKWQLMARIDGNKIQNISTMEQCHNVTI